MSAATIEQVDLAALVGDIHVRCESVIEYDDGTSEECSNPASWWVHCPCGTEEPQCTDCRGRALAHLTDWRHVGCGRGPRTWTWRPL